MRGSAFGGTCAIQGLGSAAPSSRLLVPGWSRTEAVGSNWGNVAGEMAGPCQPFDHRQVRHAAGLRIAPGVCADTSPGPCGSWATRSCLVRPPADLSLQEGRLIPALLLRSVTVSPCRGDCSRVGVLASLRGRQSNGTFPCGCAAITQPWYRL